MNADLSSREWLTAAQAAQYLSLPSVKALYQFTRRGLIPAHRLGRLLRYRRQELDNALKPTSQP